MDGELIRQVDDAVVHYVGEEDNPTRTHQGEVEIYEDWVRLVGATWVPRENVTEIVEE